MKWRKSITANQENGSETLQEIMEMEWSRMKPKNYNLKFWSFYQWDRRFSRLTEAPLLISGKTGAGKTTILMGSPSHFWWNFRKTSLWKEMRSLFATPDEETSVTFLWTSADELWNRTKTRTSFSKTKGNGTKTGSQSNVDHFDGKGKK